MASPVVISSDDSARIVLAPSPPITLTINTNVVTSGGGGGGVTSFSFNDANGVEGTVTNPSSAPELTLELTDITPTSIVASGTIAGSNLSGTNTGDQTITLTGDVTGSGTGSFAATIANDAVTFAKMQNITTNRLLGRSTAGPGDTEEISIGSGLQLSGGTLSSTAGGGSVTNFSFTDSNGIAGVVTNPTTTPNLALSLGAITPTSVVASGAVSGSNLSGTNTGDQTITLTGDVTGSGTGSFVATIANDAVTFAKMQNVSTNILLGRSTAGTGNTEEISIGSGLSLAGGTLSATGTGGTVTNFSFTNANGVSGVVTNPTTTPNLTVSLGDIAPNSVAAVGAVTGSNLSGTNTGDQTITLTGDVTGSGTGSFAATIANNAVTYAKMQDVSVASKLLGRGDSGGGDVQEITLGSGLAMTGTTLSSTASGISIGDTVTGGTQGSVLFLGVAGVLAQDNARFFFDDTNDIIFVGTNSALGAANTFTINDAATNTASGAISLSHNTSGTPTTNFGTSINFYAETTTTPDRFIGSQSFLWATAADATRTATWRLNQVITGTPQIVLQTTSAGALKLYSGAYASDGLLTLTSSATVTATSMTAGRLIIPTAAGTVTNSNNLFWDNNNKRLGIGNAINDAATYPLHVATSTGGLVTATLEYQPGGAGADGDAATLRFGLKSSTTTNRDAAAISGVWSTAADATRTGYLTFQTAYNGGSNAHRVGIRYTEATATTASISAEVTNSGLALVPNGAGAFTLRVPDGGSGGDARGSNAIDLQTNIAASTQVASGTGSVAVGRRNTASNDDAVAIGKLNAVSSPNGVGVGLSNTVSTGAGNYALGDTNNATGSVGAGCIGSTNTASAAYSTAEGFRAVASNYGQSARANGRISADGDAQTSRFVWRGQTTNNTQTEIFLDGSSQQFVLQNNQTVAFKGIAVARQTNASANASYEIKGQIHRDANAASTVLDSVTVAVIFEDVAAWDLTFTADTTNGALQCKVTGDTGDDVNWVVTIYDAEVIG